MWIWIILALILGAGLAAALIKERNEEVYEEEEENTPAENEEKAENGIMRAFSVYASFLFSVWTRLWPDWYRVDGYFWGKGTADGLTLLHPTKRRRKLFENHIKKKLTNALMVMSACVILGLTVCVCDSLGGVLEEDRIKRSDYGGGERNVEIVAEYGDKKEDMELVVREKEYTASEMEEIMENEFSSLKSGLTEGEGGEISGDVNLPGTCYEGIIDVSWRFSDYEVIDGEGHFHRENLKTMLEKSGETKYPFEVTAILSYRDIKQTRDWSFDLVMPEVGSEERLKNEIEDALVLAEENTLNEDYMALPESVSGVDISWKDRPAGIHAELLVLCIVAAMAVAASLDREVKKDVEKRSEEMTLDYPEFVSKLTLMISAGISFANAWERVSRGYEAARESGRKKHFVYEEMLITLHEMQSGIPDIKALETFGERCRIPCYKRFSTLVAQSMKKGLSGLTESLGAEARQSFEIRKSNAKVMGEQATTKLLLPMGIMLGIVLVIVMAPAFMSLSL